MSDNQTLPLLAVRDIVVYPHMQIALFVGREKSICAIELAKEHHDGMILVVSQKDSLTEEIELENLHPYGTLCRIVSTMPHDGDDKTLKVLIEGLSRAKVQNITDDNVFVATFHEENVINSLTSGDQEAQKSILLGQFNSYAEANLRNARELTRVASRIDGLLELIYFVATRIAMPLDDKQQILNDGNIHGYLNILNDYFIKSQTEQSLENELQESVRKQLENNHREYVLNEKMKAIKSELSGLNDGEDDDDSELEKRLADTDLPDEVRKKAESEFKKLKQMPSSSSEASVVRGYVEWILDTPWKKASKVSTDIKKATTILDKDHYGLDDVKDRILEYLAVQSRVKKLRGPILCLVGPPGVGKTSLGESIARATGRKFVRYGVGRCA